MADVIVFSLILVWVFLLGLLYGSWLVSRNLDEMLAEPDDDLDLKRAFNKLSPAEQYAIYHAYYADKKEQGNEAGTDQ